MGPDPDADPNAGDQCSFVYTLADGSAAASCAFGLDQAEPCRQAVSCLCSVELLNRGQIDQQACVDSWLTPRGAITFSDFCAEDAADATRTLSEALTQFAQAYGDSVRVGAECDSLRAYY